MGYILHTILHFVIGAGIANLIINRDLSRSKRVLIIIFGGIAAISPDFTKFFGDILGHSIWFTGVFGLIFAIIFRVFVKDFSFRRLWLVFTLTVLIGHIFIDYIGNGVAFLYPFNTEEFDFHIIKEIDAFIILTISIVLIATLILPKGKMIILSGILIISLYIFGLSLSKLQLEHALVKQFKDESISLLITYPSHNNFEWAFHVRTDKVWYSGYSSIYSKEIIIEEERKFND